MRPSWLSLAYPIGYIDVMNVVRSLRQAAGITQEALAAAGGTSQPTVAAYESKRKSPTYETLCRLAESVGLEVAVTFHPPMTREDRRSLALHRAIAKHLTEDPEKVLAHARRTFANMQAGPAGSSALLREWSVLLDRPPSALATLLTDPDPWARELRHVTPFAGVLSAAERAAVYRRFREDERKRPA